MKRHIAVAFLGLCFANVARPQAQSGTIVGTVTDQAGAVIPGATVTLVNEATNFMRAAVANASASMSPTPCRRAHMSSR